MGMGEADDDESDPVDEYFDYNCQVATIFDCLRRKSGWEKISGKKNLKSTFRFWVHRL